MNDSNGSASQTLNWDLSTSHSIEQIDWPADSGSDSFSLENVTLHLSLPGGRAYDGTAGNVFVQQSGGLISSITVHSQPQGLEGAYAEATRLASAWGLDQQPIETWYRERSANPGDTFSQFQTYSSGDGADFLIESLHSFNDSAPWIVSAQVTWP